MLIVRGSVLKQFIPLFSLRGQEFLSTGLMGGVGVG